MENYKILLARPIYNILDPDLHKIFGSEYHEGLTTKQKSYRRQKLIRKLNESNIEIRKLGEENVVLVEDIINAVQSEYISYSPKGNFIIK